MREIAWSKVRHANYGPTRVVLSECSNGNLATRVAIAVVLNPLQTWRPRPPLVVTVLGCSEPARNDQ